MILRRLLLFARLPSPIQYLHEFNDAAVKRRREPDEHGESGECVTAFHVADERVIRLDQCRELLLGKPARDAKFTQAPAEDHSITLAFSHG